MKTQEERNAIRAEYETLNTKLAELTDEELAQVTGGVELPADLQPVMDPYTSELCTIEAAQADPHTAEPSRVDLVTTEIPKADQHISKRQSQRYKDNHHGMDVPF